MKTVIKTLSIFILSGILFWTIESAVDSIFFYDLSFFDLISLSGVSSHEIYTRLLVVLILFVLGIILSVLFLRLKHTNIKLKTTILEMQEVNRRLENNEMELKASNQQLRAINQQLYSSEQQLRASEQQQFAVNQQLRAIEQDLRNEIEKHIVSRKNLEISERRYQMMFNQMTNGVAVYEAADGGKDFIIKGFNAAAEKIEKASKEEVIDRSVLEVFPGVIEFGIFDAFKRVYKTGKPEYIPVKQYRDERLSGWRENYIYKLQTGEIVAIYEDATEKKITEQYESATKQILEMLNEPGDFTKIIENILELIKKEYSIDAIGIRLQRETDYPYIWHSGFPKEFINSEKSIISVFPDCDNSGIKCNIELDCFCGAVINGNIKRLSGFSTGYGSFCSDSTEQISKNSDKISKVLGVRSVCYNSGYESLALIPLKIKENIIGLFHLASSKKKWFEKNQIKHFEHISKLIISAIKRKEILEALQFGEQRLKYAFEAASEGIWDWDLYLNKVYFSPRFYTMLEYVPDEFPASIENLFNLIHEADVEKIKSSFFNFILSPEENYEQIFRMKTKTENEIWIMARGKIVELKNGKPARFIGTHIDITEQIKTHNKLLHSEKLSAVGQLASGIAHEFNNILAIIKSYAQLVLLQLDSSPDYTEIMTEIDNQVKRGSNIVKSIMAFSRPREMVKELCDIKTLINRVIKIQNNFLELENIEIFTNFNYDSLLYVDANQIEQVLINVVLNARHAIAPKKKGIITVSAEEKNGYITITVTDTGIGIPEDKIKKIFEPFYTTKGARGNNNLNIGGTGLGLSVCYTIIKNHGGFISVESKINEGASFMISLPVEQNGDKILMENSNNSEKKVFDAPELKLLEREMKIIIVDDERLIADMLSRALKKIINAEIDCYYNGCDAIDNFLKKKYDIAFLDLLMPGIDGLKISEEFKKLEPSIKIVFMSGQIGLELDSFMSKDIFGYIQKPFSISDIIKVLNKIE